MMRSMASVAPSLWRNRSYMLLLSGETVSSFGAQIAHIALTVTAVNYLAATEFQVGLLGAVETVAFLVLALPAGAWVDRMSHRRVMIAANILRAALLSLIPAAWAFGVLSISWLMWVGLAIGVCRVFFDVAFMSIVPSLVPVSQLTDANARLHGTLEVANIAGPTTGGYLAKVISAPILPLATVLGFLTSAFAVWRIPERALRKSEVPRNLGHEIREGVDFVRHHPLVSRLVLSATVTNFFGTLMMTMFPVLVLRYFELDEGQYGLLMTISSLGAIAGALAGPVFAKRLGEGHAVPVTALLEGIGSFSMPVSMLVPRPMGPYVLAAGGFVVLFAILSFNVCQVSLRQRACPPRLYGRMNATVRFAVWGVIPIASLVSGVIAHSWGLAATFWIGAVGGLLGTGFVVFSPLWGLKKMDAYAYNALGDALAEAPPSLPSKP